MRIGASLFLIAVGAILKFAVTDKVNGIDLGVVGVILIVIGVVGLLFELFMWGPHRRTRTVVHHTPAAPVVGQPVVGQPVVAQPNNVAYVQDPNNPVHRAY